MNSLFQEFLSKFVFVFLDEILKYSKSKEEHMEHLELLFEVLRTNELFAGKKNANLLLSKYTTLDM